MLQSHHDFDVLTLAYADAVRAKDPSRLAAMYDNDVRVFDAWEQWSYDGLAAWRPSIDGWLGSLGDDNVLVTFDDVSAFAHGDMGFLTASVTYAAVDRNGKRLRSLQDRLTWVLANTGERWLIVHQHTSFPIAFADQRAILRRA